jgi:hypothetical protein
MTTRIPELAAPVVRAGRGDLTPYLIRHVR